MVCETVRGIIESWFEEHSLLHHEWCRRSNRSIEENLMLFENMKAGKYGDGEKVLRAKINMDLFITDSNINVA